MDIALRTKLLKGHS